MNQDDNKKRKNEEVIEEEQQEEINGIQGQEVREKTEELELKYKRALADYQNLEKRVIEDRREWIRSANRELLTRFLPLSDTLQLAYRHTKDKGLEVTIKQFEDMLKNEGVTKIETKGKDFDPNFMECVKIISGEEGKVVDEVRPGYLLHDKLLRVAQVTVGGGKKASE